MRFPNPSNLLHRLVENGLDRGSNVRNRNGAELAHPLEGLPEDIARQGFDVDSDIWELGMNLKGAPNSPVGPV